MGKSNRRPLYDDADAPQPSDTVSSVPAPAAAPAALPSSTAAATAQPVAATPPAFKQPCTFKGAASAVYAGALGYFLGVVPATIKFKARQWGMIHTQGLASAQQLAIMSGLYTAVHCICQRIRLVEDGWNRGIAGCSTGLVLGWNGGPWSALQSCAGLGLLSALIDLGGGVEAAEARVLQPLHSNQQQQQHVRKQAHSLELPADMQQQEQQQVLAGLPQPVQLLVLLLGASPSSMSAAAAAGDGAAGCQDGAAANSTSHGQQQQHARRRPGSSNAHEGAATVPAEQQRRSQQQQQQQQQPAVLFAQQLVAPGTRAVQQLLSAPPLMFLGACCHTGAGAAAAGADVDGCPVALPAAAPARSKPQ